MWGLVSCTGLSEPEAFPACCSGSDPPCFMVGKGYVCIKGHITLDLVDIWEYQ